MAQAEAVVGERGGCSLTSPVEAVQNVGRNAIPTYIEYPHWLGMGYFLILNLTSEDFLDSLQGVVDFFRRVKPRSPHRTPLESRTSSSAAQELVPPHESTQLAHLEFFDICIHFLGSR
jgi:hypothetical protein